MTETIKSGITNSPVDARKKSCIRMIQEHPCYGTGGPLKFAKIHLPIASSCSTGCNYCTPNHNCNETSPSESRKVTTAQQAIEQVRIAAKDDRRLRVIEIAGPGDPLSNDVTYETLGLIKEEFPHFTRCVITNGLLLPQKLNELKEAGVAALTITVNAVDADVGSQIYSYIEYGGKKLHGKAAFKVLSRNQLKGLRDAVGAGIVVRVNSVYIPGINSSHLVEVAKTVADLGASVHNILPLIPQGRFAYIAAPTLHEIQQSRRDCGEYIFQLHNCNQCTEICERFEEYEIGAT